MVAEKKAKKVKEVKIALPIRIDLGAGPNKKEGFIGVDVIKFPGVDIQLNIGTEVWPWDDNSVEEAHTSHTVEHLNQKERVHFINELHRVLKPGSSCTLIVPHWASCRAYGDLTHQWPPVSEFWFYYLSKDWRKINAPHSTYADSVDFECTWGYGLNQNLTARSAEFKQFAMENYKEALTDIMANLKKKA
jgi:hypothetical protein